jgi:hypothetical protein
LEEKKSIENSKVVVSEIGRLNMWSVIVLLSIEINGKSCVYERTHRDYRRWESSDLDSKKLKSSFGDTQNENRGTILDV